MTNDIVHRIDDSILTACGLHLAKDATHATAGEVDCMACIAGAGKPSFEDTIAAALGLPKEFLFCDETT
jgi:hypothetical protein